MKYDVPLAHTVCLSPSQVFSDFMQRPLGGKKKKNTFILLLPFLVLHIKKKKCAVVIWVKSYYFIGPHLKMFLLLFQVVK